MKSVDELGLFQYFQSFGSEESCVEHLVNSRKSDGITCKCCKEVTKHYYIRSIKQFRCSICRAKTGLRSDTYMADSNLPVHYWYFATYMMTNLTKSLSAREMQRQIGHKFYEPIWYMMHKIRTTMKKRDDLYSIGESLEVDEGYIDTYLTKLEKDERPKLISTKLKRRTQGIDKDYHTPVLVVAESKYTTNDNKWKPNKSVRYIRLIGLEDRSKEGLSHELTKLLKGGESVVTDGYVAYKDIFKKLGVNHAAIKPESWEPKDVILDEHLPWVHKVLSNFKRNILNAHHSISHKYIDNYLAEFQYKFNRRMHRQFKFEHLIGAGLSMRWD